MSSWSSNFLSTPLQLEAQTSVIEVLHTEIAKLKESMDKNDN